MKLDADLRARAAVHAALGDPVRLAIVEELAVSDRTAAELRRRIGIESNLAAHHLGVLEGARLIERFASDGDRRRRYVRLRAERATVLSPVTIRATSVVFVCSHNSARSQFAAAMWRQATGAEVASAGTHPAEQVHPHAIRVAAEFGIDLSSATPGGYDTIPWDPTLVISVCDRAHEGQLPEGKAKLHWSIPDPVAAGTIGSFRSAFTEIARRVDHLTGNSTNSRLEE